MSSAEIKLRRLLHIMAQLRDPNSGCPWDLQQDFASIAPHSIEEAYELSAAIEAKDPAAIRDELGDMLFQVVFHARLAEERGWFDFAAVVTAICDKLERRHPHVFAEREAQSRPSDAALGQQWEAAKATERAARGEHGVLANVPLALPALTRAQKLGKRAAATGFDWPDSGGARLKLDEEVAEFDAAIAAGDAQGMREELGDMLFSMVNIARLNGINAEQALREVNGKFDRRFALMEAAVKRDGKALKDLDFAAWDAYWEAAKRFSRGSDSTE